MQRESLSFEAGILDTLDRCLLKMSEILVSRFDPNNPDSIKLLKLFRSTLSVRRVWAKVYNLVPSPTSRGTAPNSPPSQCARKTNASKTDSDKLNIPQSNILSKFSIIPVVSSHLDKVTQALSKPIAKTPELKNGLLCP